jgi:hypothetical protein
MGVCIGMAGCPTCGGSPAAVARCREMTKNAVPINNAARRAQGLPEDPNEPKDGGPGYEDYVFGQAMLASGAKSTDPKDIEDHLREQMRRMGLT